MRLLRKLEGLHNRQQLLGPHGARTRPGRMCPLSAVFGSTDHSQIFSRQNSHSGQPAADSRGRGYRQKAQITLAGKGNTARRPRGQGRLVAPRMRGGSSQPFPGWKCDFCWALRLDWKWCCVENGGRGAPRVGRRGARLVAWGWRWEGRKATSGGSGLESTKGRHSGVRWREARFAFAQGANGRLPGEGVSDPGSEGRCSRVSWRGQAEVLRPS